MLGDGNELNNGAVGTQQTEQGSPEPWHLTEQVCFQQSHSILSRCHAVPDQTVIKQIIVKAKQPQKEAAQSWAGRAAALS